MFIALKSCKLLKIFWIILLVGILIGIYSWLNLAFSIDLKKFWLVGIVLSFLLVLILHQLTKLWIIPIVVFLLDLIYHFKFPYTGELFITYYLVDIPFLVLTILFTIWIYILRKIKNGIKEDN
ncbi:hypothetical protein Desaci_0972 [Desulfosporosinus acidiphilus SJ4]|uniref:Uncharacterized protein n=1 Tax=Desulfosporosinus acidiphilus (strain DSM 22704 / JCM 16185 / SJ4) TaxID=646529 RepID=I4D2J3_DESAJ|nr:hypothetical protein [Desulfosporosinus acidiphilus]AFM40017.1 hypothetical protein Desaci_0972 [Desulfosporosinus acidiphilus SJ4]